MLDEWTGVIASLHILPMIWGGRGRNPPLGHTTDPTLLLSWSFWDDGLFFGLYLFHMLLFLCFFWAFVFNGFLGLGSLVHLPLLCRAGCSTLGRGPPRPTSHLLWQTASVIAFTFSQT